jgi:hypothetical protein
MDPGLVGEVSEGEDDRVESLLGLNVNDVSKLNAERPAPSTVDFPASMHNLCDDENAAIDMAAHIALLPVLAELAAGDKQTPGSSKTAMTGRRSTVRSGSNVSGGGMTTVGSMYAGGT